RLRERDRVDRLAFAKEERAAIARDVQIADAAAESAESASAAAFSFIVAAALPRRDAREPAPILLNRIDDRRVARAGHLAGHEDDSATVGCDGIIEYRRWHARQLARAAFESRPVNIDFARRLVALWRTGAARTAFLIGGFGLFRSHLW